MKTFFTEEAVVQYAVGGAPLIRIDYANEQVQPILEENERLKKALKYLLADDEEHDCGDEDCPVEIAKAALGDEKVTPQELAENQTLRELLLEALLFLKTSPLRLAAKTLVKRIDEALGDKK